MINTFIEKYFSNFCERGQRCSCWFDGWWGDACAEHDKDYQERAYLGSKLSYDLKLWIGVTLANKWLSPIGFVMGLVMFVALSLAPRSYGFYNKYRIKTKKGR